MLNFLKNLLHRMCDGPPCTWRNFQGETPNPRTRVYEGHTSVDGHTCFVRTDAVRADGALISSTVAKVLSALSPPISANFLWMRLAEFSLEINIYGHVLPLGYFELAAIAGLLRVDVFFGGTFMLQICQKKSEIHLSIWHIYRLRWRRATRWHYIRDRLLEDVKIDTHE